jgi:hypothetical protein
MRLPSKPNCLGSWLAAIAAAALLGVAAMPAAATPASEIERIWSFNGGEVSIVKNGAKLEGIVVKATTFKECSHEVGEHMWTEMTLQPNGSYWGLHQWFYQAPGCVLNEPGRTAWRVLHKPDGSKYLLVCFSEPGSTMQPEIGPEGATAHWTFGCAESAPVGLNPVVSNGGGQGGGSQQGGGAGEGELVTFKKAVGLPKGCVARHSLKLKLRDPKHDPLKEVVVRIHGKKIADVSGVKRLRKGIVLKGLPSGKYTLEITATTVLDQKLSGRRTYHSCGKNATGGLPLHSLKSRRHH